MTPDAASSKPEPKVRAAGEFQLVSAPFASGVAWLVNVLLELGIRTTHVSSRYPNGFWQGKGPDRRDAMSPEARDFMGWHLPVVFERANEFDLEHGIEVFWEHRLDFARHSHRPTIVFVRDPRDAIYSLYRRDYAGHFEPLQYLQRPDLFPDHFPGMFNLPPADTWAAWHAMWLGLQQVMRIQFVRFEALRASPVAGIQQVLVFLGTSRSAADIERALERSSLERTLAALAKQEQLKGVKRQTARKGKVGEWQETYTPEMLECFRGPASAIMTQLAYEPVSGAVAQPSTAGNANQPSVVPGFLPGVEEAHRLWDAGRFDNALAALRRCAATAGTDPQQRLELASEFVALDWTLKVFGPDLATSPVAKAARAAFLAFNQQFTSWLPMQRMLLAAVDASAIPISDAQWPPGSSGTHEPPVLIETNCRGYNLVRYGGWIHAVSQALGPVDLQSLSEQDWNSHRRAGRILPAHDALSAKAAVNEWRRGQRPNS